MPFEEEVTPQFEDVLSRAKVHVGIRKLVSGSFSCRVHIFSEIALRLSWKAGERISIFIGSGTDAGCVRLMRSPNGLAKLKEARQGTRGKPDGSLIVMLGNFKGLPQKEFTPASAHFEVVGNGALDIDLPFSPEEALRPFALPKPRVVPISVSVPAIREASAKHAGVTIDHRPDAPINADNDPPLPKASIWSHPTDMPNVVDPEVRKLRKEGTWHSVPPKEWAIFEKLAQNEGKIISDKRIWNHLYGDDADGGADEKIIDVFICRLRKICPFRIETVFGSGYILHGYAMFRNDTGAKPNLASGVDKSQLMKGK